MATGAIKQISKFCCKVVFAGKSYYIISKKVIFLGYFTHTHREREREREKESQVSVGRRKNSKDQTKKSIET